MSDVIVNFKVMPADASADLEKMESGIKAKMDAKNIEKEPIAFGLVALKMTVIVDDSEGATDKIENEIRSVEGVGEVEVTGMSRAL